MMRSLRMILLLLVGLSLTLGEKMRMTPTGEFIQEDGGTLEDYELRERHPHIAYFMEIGKHAHGKLQKAGYAYGDLVGVRHSDMEGESMNEKGMFPMSIILTVIEVSSSPIQVEADYQVTVSYDPMKYVSPGLAVTDGRKLTAEGEVLFILELLPTEAPSFFEKNRRGITLMFGVFIASAVVKFIRRGVEISLAARRGKGRSGNEGGQEDPPSVSGAVAAGDPSADGAEAKKGKGKGNGADHNPNSGGGRQKRSSKKRD